LEHLATVRQLEPSNFIFSKVQTISPAVAPSSLMIAGGSLFDSRLAEQALASDAQMPTKADFGRA
jgi:hypothetical protein